MRARISPEDRRLPDAQRARLVALIEAVPEGAGPDDPAVQRLLGFCRSLKVPWWASGAAVAYRAALGDIDGCLHALRQLAACVDWGEPATGDRPATGWKIED